MGSQGHLHGASQRVSGSRRILQKPWHVPGLRACLCQQMAAVTLALPCLWSVVEGAWQETAVLLPDANS